MDTVGPVLVAHALFNVCMHFMLFKLNNEFQIIAFTASGMSGLLVGHKSNFVFQLITNSRNTCYWIRNCWILAIETSCGRRILLRPPTPYIHWYM